MIDSKLLTLLSISETGSFSRAAKNLSLSQPAVSMQLKQLESELGAKLLIRTKNSVKLTKEGEIALHYAKRIKALYARLGQKIEDSRTESFSLTIGITHSAQNSPVIEAIAKVATENKKMHISFVTGLIKDLYESIDEYGIDLAIVEGKNEDPTLSSILLDTDTLLAAISPANPLSRKTTVTLKELSKEKLILRSKNSGTRDLLDSSLSAKGISPTLFDIAVESQSLGIIKDLVEKNLGVSILARSTCEGDAERGKIVLLPIDGLPMKREVNLIYPKDFQHPDVLKELVKAYQETKHHPLAD